MLPIDAPTLAAATHCGMGVAQTWAGYLSEAAAAATAGLRVVG